MKSLIGNKKYVVSIFVTILIILGIQNVCYGQSRIVRLFYFLPNDRSYRAHVVDAMKTGILEVQSFYAEQMAAHGHGNMTFNIETDAQGNPIVHRVNGDHGNSHYINTLRPGNEITRAFDTSSIVQLVVMDISKSSGGNGVGIKQKGRAVIFGRWNWSSAAHELGHAFGLQHDFRDDAHIMSYGDQNSLSAGAAHFLSVNPYFNSSVPLQAGSLPSVQLLSSTNYMYGVVGHVAGQPIPPFHVPVRVRVRDPEGLQQVSLFVKTPKGIFGIPGGFHEVIEYRNLSGQTDMTVTFNYEGNTPSVGDTNLLNRLRHTVYVTAVDRQGNRIEAPQASGYTLQAVNIPELDVPLRDRSPRVADSIYNVVRLFHDRSVSSYEHITDAHLADIKTMFVNNIGDSLDGAYLKPDDFDGLTNLTRLELRYKYGYWAAYLLPDGIFEGLTSLHTLISEVNRKFPIGLVKVGENQFKAVAPAGAPFDIVLPLTVVNGGINGGATTITIPQGSVESALLTVARTPGTKSAVRVFIDKYPSLPERHRGYYFVNVGYPSEPPSDKWSGGEVVEIFDSLDGAPTDLKTRTPQILEAIVKAVPTINTSDIGKERTLYLGGWGVSTTFTIDMTFYALYVSDTDLAAITSLDISNAELTELKLEDFDELTNLTTLDLGRNDLTSLPKHIFDELTNLTTLDLGGNDLTSLIPTTIGGIPDIPIFRKPSAIFDELTNLTTLDLGGNDLTSLPASVFDELTNLTTLDLGSNNLTSLSESIFDELTNLIVLDLGSNDLTSLPTGVFDNFANLIQLDLNYNDLSSLPAGIFDNTTNLAMIDLEDNDLSSLPAGIFDNTTNLAGLNLGSNDLSSLPAGIFDNTTNLLTLALHENQLSALPAGIFSQLTNHYITLSVP